MGFMKILRVRTYRMTFRRNGEALSKTLMLVRMYTAKERETLVIETVHFPLSGLFRCPRDFAKAPWTGSERYGFHCHRLQEMFRRTASCRRADHKKSCRHFRLGQQRSPQRPHSPSGEPSESPRHFAASMDESVIVGYYTLKKCRSPALPLSVNLKERT